MLKLVKIKKDRKCHMCDNLIKKDKGRVLTTGFCWFCSIECYNDFEAQEERSLRE